MEKILVVDDLAGPRNSLAAYLLRSNPDWIIDKAESAERAIALISKNGYDLVITDWILTPDAGGGPSGLDVLKAARDLDPFTMVIVTTAYDDTINRYKDVFKFGAYDCIPKAAPGIDTPREILLKSQVALQIRQLHKHSSSFSRYIDPRVIHALKSDPAKLALTESLVTIVFCDIRGFSASCKLLTGRNDIVAQLLEQFYDLVATTAKKYDGVVDKYIGDGAMILFGSLPKAKFSDDDGDIDAYNAVQAAHSLCLDIKPILESAKANFRRAVLSNVPELKLGVGIHTGVVRVGLIKTSERDQFTAVGHDVNLAQRFESCAGKRRLDGRNYGSILISRTVKMRVEAKVSLEPEGILTELKNLPEPVEAWSVTGVKGAP